MYKSAQEQYKKSLELSTLMHDTVQMAYDYRNIGETYLQQYGDKTSQLALEGIITAKNYLKSAELTMPDTEGDYATAERIGNYISLADCYIKLAKLQDKPEYIDSCRHYVNLFKKSNLSEVEGFLLASQAEADMLMLEHQYDQALPILLAALQNSIEEGSEHNEMSINKRLSECYDHAGDKSKALDALKRHYALKEKITNETEMRRASEYAAQREVKAERERSEQERIRNEERRHRQTVINISLATVLAMMSVIAFLIYQAFRQKRRSNEALMGKNAMLAQQKEEIAIQKEKLSYTNRQMRESITYAQRIQRTVISSQEEMDAVFPQNFVLYRPRDIVSGDFYRIYAIRGHKIIVVADCTGHGVPGALLSMMGISALKDIFGQLEITGGDIEPAAILQQLRNFVKDAFNKNTTDPRLANSDGMDMSICVLRPDGETLDFAGANQNAIIVHDGAVTRLKGDFMPIGYYVSEKDFTTHQIKVSAGDMLYLFTDGIQDQLGGPDDSKFSLKRLTDRLATLSSLDLEKQMYDIERDI
jgi:serine phosphatase RsbU (regulator of sigma subunit)